MDWIKNNTAQFVLALLALALLGFSAMLLMNAQGFEETFAGIRGQVVKNTKVQPVELSMIEQARKGIAQPRAWAGKSSLFVSPKYILKEGAPVPIERSGSIHNPVPNSWIEDNGLELLNMNILKEDADGDGFTNLEEWKGNDPSPENEGKASTDPQNKASHPPIYLKLRMARFIERPFRLKFNSHEGNTKQPETMTFQIDTVDLRQTSQFRKLGEVIEGTVFKIIRFRENKQMDPSIGIETDVSELTVQNTENNKEIVLILEKTVNSPDSFGVFRLLTDNTEYSVKKEAEFTLKNHPQFTFRLISIDQNGAVLENTANGQKVSVPKLEGNP